MPLGTLGLFSLSEKESKKPKLLISANFAIRSDVFKKIKFDVAFGRRNTLMYKWEEDVEYCQRLTYAGYLLKYVPTAIVYHNVNIKRMGFRYLLMKEFCGGLSHYLVERKHKARILIGVSSFRLFISALLVFSRERSLKNFCWLIKMATMNIAFIFIPV